MILKIHNKNYTGKIFKVQINTFSSNSRFIKRIKMHMEKVLSNHSKETKTNWLVISIFSNLIIKI